ncbi:MAG: porin family protein, partial [marine benthic group bacterium]|nr:porin family protein [Candidatus Benthicola marisminoris]
MMKAVKGIIASLALLLVFSGEAKAQDWWWGLTYQMSATSSLPGNSNSDVNFIEDFSFRGLGIDARYVPSRGSNYSFGFNFGWNVFSEKNDFGTERNTISLPNADISGTQLRYFNSVPLLANASYYFGDRGGIRPFVGVNAGTYYIERRVDIGVSAVVDDAWHFGWAPEIGLVVPLGRPEVALLTQIRYNWAFSSGGSGDQKYWGFNIGIAYR